MYIIIFTYTYIYIYIYIHTHIVGLQKYIFVTYTCMCIRIVPDPKESILLSPQIRHVVQSAWPNLGCCVSDYFYTGTHTRLEAHAYKQTHTLRMNTLFRGCRAADRSLLCQMQSIPYRRQTIIPAWAHEKIMPPVLSMRFDMVGLFWCSPVQEGEFSVQEKNVCAISLISSHTGYIDLQWLSTNTKRDLLLGLRRHFVSFLNRSVCHDNPWHALTCAHTHSFEKRSRHVSDKIPGIPGSRSCRGIDKFTACMHAGRCTASIFFAKKAL